MVSGLEGFLRHVVSAHDHLQKAGAIAYDEEVDLAARPPVVQPPFDGDRLTDVLADFFYVNAHLTGPARNSCRAVARTCGVPFPSAPTLSWATTCWRLRTATYPRSQFSAVT